MESNTFPKILIITVNPLSNTSNNGKTYASFFKDYPKKCLAQLYFHREIPTSNICENYYKISDEDIIKNILCKSKNMGKKMHIQDKEERVIPKTITNILKKSSLIRFGRALLWTFFNFQREDLNNWLNDFKPNIIFFGGGDSNYLYNKVLKLSKKFNAKIVYYIGDDYVLLYFSLNPFYLLNRWWTRSAFKKMCRSSSLILTIGDKMARIYKEKFGIESEKLMNLVNVETNEINAADFKSNNLKFVYTGSLHSNRWKTLLLMGKSFQRLEKYGIKATIEIYSQHRPQERIFKAINNKHYSKYCGALNENGVKKALKVADVLVHVESFNYWSQRATYLSISTKIPEYMATGKCILAFGPSKLASIEYLNETNSAIVITSVKNQVIDDILREVIVNPQKRNAYAKRSLLIAKKNHDITQQRYKFQEKLKNI